MRVSFPIVQDPENSTPQLFTLDKFKYSISLPFPIKRLLLMISEEKRLFRRKDGKYLIYLPKDLEEDSIFPFKAETPSLLK